MERQINLKVAKAIKDKHMVMNPLAHILKISQPQLSLMMRGKGGMKASYINPILEYIDMTWEELNAIELDEE